MRPETEAALTEMIGALNDDDREVRQSALNGIGGFARLRERAIPALIEVIQSDRDVPLRDGALIILVLWGVLDDCDRRTGDTNELACDVLQSIRDREAQSSDQPSPN